MWIDVNINECVKVEVSIMQVLDEINGNLRTPADKAVDALRLMNSCLLCLKNIPDAFIGSFTDSQRDLIIEILTTESQRYMPKLPSYENAFRSQFPANTDFLTAKITPT
jgi:hypothetical protein